MRKTGGLKANLGDLHDGELYICTDTNEIFLGTTCGNQKISPPYKQALLTVTQSSTNAPVVTEIMSEFPGVTWTGGRSDLGEYTITASESLTDDASNIEVWLVENNTSANIVTVNAGGTDTIGLATASGSDGTSADGLLNGILKIVVRD